MFTDDEKKELINFEGYGSAKPVIVFIGYEEKSVDRESLADDVAARLQQRRLLGSLRVDKNEFHSGHHLLDKEKPLIPGTVKVWNFASRITYELINADPRLQVSADQKPPDSWQEEYHRLGTETGITLLTELLPFPRPNHGAFTGTYLSDWYRGRTAMEREVLPARQRMLNRIVSEPSVRYVFMYGARYRDYRDEWKPILGEQVPDWTTVETRLREAKVGRMGETVIIRSEFFGGAAPTKLTYDDIPIVVKAAVEASKD